METKNLLLPPEGNEDFETLMKLRLKMRSHFNQNKPLIPDTIVKDIDKFLPALDDWMTTYKDGLIPHPPELNDEERSEDSGMYLAGIWKADAFDKVEADMNSIVLNLKTLFRKLFDVKEVD